MENFYWILNNYKFIAAGWVVYMITLNLSQVKIGKKKVNKYYENGIERLPFEHPNLDVVKTKTKSHIQQNMNLATSVNEDPNLAKKKSKEWMFVVIYGTMKFLFFPVFINKNK